MRASSENATCDPHVSVSFWAPRAGSYRGMLLRLPGASGRARYERTGVRPTFTNLRDREGVNPFPVTFSKRRTRPYARFLDAPAAADDRARLTRGVGGIDLAGPPPAAFRVDVLRSGRPAPRPDSVGRSYAYEVAIETEAEEGARKRANVRAMRACIGGSGSESKCMCYTSTFFRYASTSGRLRDDRHPR